VPKEKRADSDTRERERVGSSCMENNSKCGSSILFATYHGRDSLGVTDAKLGGIMLADILSGACPGNSIV